MSNNTVMSQLIHAEDIYQDLVIVPEGRENSPIDIITIALIELLLKLPTKKEDEELDLEEVVDETINIVNDMLKEELCPSTGDEEEDAACEDKETLYVELASDFITDVLASNDHDILLSLSDTLKEIAKTNKLEYSSKLVEGGVLLSWKVINNE